MTASAPLSSLTSQTSLPLPASRPAPANVPFRMIEARTAVLYAPRPAWTLALTERTANGAISPVGGCRAGIAIDTTRSTPVGDELPVCIVIDQAVDERNEKISVLMRLRTYAGACRPVDL